MQRRDKSFLAFFDMSPEVAQTIVFCLTPLACLLFINALLDDGSDDDNGPGGGMLQPIQTPVANPI